MTQIPCKNKMQTWTDGSLMSCEKFLDGPYPRDWFNTKKEMPWYMVVASRWLSELWFSPPPPNPRSPFPHRLCRLLDIHIIFTLNCLRWEQISPSAPPEGPLNLPGTCCLSPPPPIHSPASKYPLSPLPFHGPLWSLKFACIFQICLDNMKMCCVYCWQLFSSFLKSISKEPFIASSLYPDLIWFQSSPLDTEQVSTVISLLSTSARPSSLSAYLKKGNIYVKVSVYTHINAYVLCTTTVFWP